MSDNGHPVSTHYTCAKGNDHWLSHVIDWGPFDQFYFDGCHVVIHVEAGHIVHLTVMPDDTQEAST